MGERKRDAETKIQRQTERERKKRDREKDRKRARTIIRKATSALYVVLGGTHYIEQQIALSVADRPRRQLVSLYRPTLSDTIFQLSSSYHLLLNTLSPISSLHPITGDV